MWNPIWRSVKIPEDACCLVCNLWHCIVFGDLEKNSASLCRICTRANHSSFYWQWCLKKITQEILCISLSFKSELCVIQCLYWIGSCLLSAYLPAKKVLGYLPPGAKNRPWKNSSDLLDSLIVAKFFSLKCCVSFGFGEVDAKSTTCSLFIPVMISYKCSYFISKQILVQEKETLLLSCPFEFTSGIVRYAD